ncbi:MAG: hypothetical protein HN742_11185 [Lentisphaerae bacterium]|jgi:hypothetical protein|nr:hypothetical protein [Lentisphaerota bacterium]MBT4822160.1 hypothetical protein [Lentisphaerota bacterium]MBT5610517.1 hypothetical protein [Lentisphaerota bacterium]MBT7056072.1 hypothetical protein [Lentisphaerota bacterium]MBT7842429.1 hypothetical protein [Lentisphaerota bacterium]
MENTTSTDPHLEEQLSEMNRILRDIHEEVSQILSCVQDELEAFREREFWRDHAQFYQHE